MMRSFLSTLIVSIFCSKLGYAYISQSSSGTGWRRHDNANAGAEKSFKQPPANIKIDDIFREEYHEWCKRYGRSVGDGIRFENFKLNFMLQMQQNKRSGTFNLLNEFGDITAREFNEIVKGKITNNDEKDTSSATATNTSSSSSSPPRKKSSGVAVIAELIIEPIPKVSILGPSNLSTLKDKSRNYNNLSGRNNSGESYQQRAAPRYSSAAGPVVRPTLQRSTVDQATSDNNNINSNNSRSHRKVGPDQAPNNNRNNN
ncbi:hypothetical protein FRACYDRAFT_268583, partial [Fragilariopsis cylindrus CCMP1102]